MSAAYKGLPREFQLSALTIAMERGFPCVCLLLFFITIGGISSFKIKNKQLNKCLQVQEGSYGGRVSLSECNPDSSLQEWRWLPDSRALSSQHTGECLTAPRGQYEGVHLQECSVRKGGEAADEDANKEASRQAWTCSKKGHLTLMAKGLHLNAAQSSTLVFLSREHKQGSRWRTLDDQALCNATDSKHSHSQPPHHQRETMNPQASSEASDPLTQVETDEATTSTNVTESNSVLDVTQSPLNTKSVTDPTVMFYNMVYGMGWKITMLVVSSLALLVGIAILAVSLYFNRRKKVVCVLKSYTPRPEMVAHGSPGRSEKAPLTEHAMRLPYSSPNVQQGEILIEWKDGTVTPLYKA